MRRARLTTRTALTLAGPASTPAFIMRLPGYTGQLATQ